MKYNNNVNITCMKSNVSRKLLLFLVKVYIGGKQGKKDQSYVKLILFKIENKEN
ncbi:hypothetical protein HanIR_Chr12g0564901 [Helianthus annuus]|nr:hypothetical protein HanIR_Chr12g0564901 [Helianthus annuus]